MVVEIFGVNGVKFVWLSVEEEVLVFLVKVLDMLGGVSNVSLADGVPRITNECIDVLRGRGVLGWLGRWGVRVGA